MSTTRSETVPIETETSDQKKGWLATGGVVGAILASSCCIGPLALLSLGISGAWIGNLTALEPYKPVFAAIALVFIGLGFRQVYFEPKLVCVEGSHCARSASAIVTKTALWAGTALVIAALTIDWWTPLFY
jgi:mercuric ion transport protein